MNLKDNLKKIRKENNLSQEDLAEKLNVSRQSVSKWEQGIAYPEMDKVLQICNMFNLNIDEFLNQDISKVEKGKQSKINVNKYIDDFLAFVTKTVKMFCSMSFKDKIKCILEQAFIVLILIIIFSIINEILGSIFSDLFGFLKSNVYYVIYHIFEGISYTIYVIFALIVLLHIFKIRYLDYYVIVDKEEEKEETTEEDKDNKKYINNKEEKIIIRDPKHSGYRFINGVFKMFLFLVKCLLFFVGLNFCAAVVGFAFLLAMSFMFVKSGLLFVGGFVGSLAGICLNLVILYLIYCFISNMKVNKKLTFIAFVASLVVGGMSLGLIASGFKNFYIVNDYDSKYVATTKEEINMEKDLILINDYGDNIEFVESNNKNLVIEYKYSKACKVSNRRSDEILFFIRDCSGTLIKDLVSDFNNKTFVNPTLFKVTVYTNKENIKILENNIEKFHKSERDAQISELYNRISELESELDLRDEELYELRNQD